MKIEKVSKNRWKVSYLIGEQQYCCYGPSIADLMISGFEHFYRVCKAKRYL